MASLPPARRRRLRTWAPTPHSTNDEGRLRAISSDGNDPGLRDLASNDYLNLTRHPALLEAAAAAMHEQEWDPVVLALSAEVVPCTSN